jgi:phasin
MRESAMTDKSAPYDIPPEMREFAEKSVDQARKAFDGFMEAAHKAAGTIEGSTEIMQGNAKDLGRKAMSYAEQNVAAALDFAQRLVNARDPQEIVRLQAEFVKAQVQAFGQQAKDISLAAAKFASKPEKPGK